MFSCDDELVGRELLNTLGSIMESAACWSADADVDSVKGSVISM